MNLSVRSSLLGLLAVAALVLGIERLIVTDAEAVEEVARQAARAVRAQDYAALEGLLTEDFLYAGRDRAATVEHVRSLVRKYHPTDVQIALYEVQVDGDEARAKAVVGGTVLARAVRVGVEAVFARGPDGAWRLQSVSGGEGIR